MINNWFKSLFEYLKRKFWKRREESQIGIGRKFSPDPQDKKYTLPDAPNQIDRQFWSTPPAYDQGGSAHCVAYAGARYLASGPILNEPPPFETLYRECQELDEWPGNDYEGTSVRALFKVFKKRGLIDEYRWAFDATTVINHVLTSGPVVMGTVWNADMANPTLSGYITLGDVNEISAGHAWCITGADRKKLNPDGTTGALRAFNSMGDQWGDRGMFWVTFGDLDKLIKASGEACVAKQDATQKVE